MRLFHAVTLVMFCCTLLGTAQGKSKEPQQDFQGRVLHILTWSDYLDPELVSAFEDRYRVKLRFTYFETDEHRDQMLAEHGNRGYDLAILDSFKLPLYIKRGWIDRIDRGLIPNLAHLDPRCNAASPAGMAYAVPYFWGTLGIAYRGDLVREPITHWMQLYRPREQLRGKIVMIDDSREVLGMAAIALGKSMASEDIRDWESAAQLVYEQKPYVFSYGYIAIDGSSGLVSGKLLAAQIYNGEALSLQQHNPDIVYVHPAEGSSYWVDYWTLFVNSPHRELAHAFLNYLNEPEQAARNAQSVYFATCNKSADALLPETFRQDPVIYPPEAVMQRLQPYRLLPPRVTRKIHTLYSQITQGP